MDVVARDEEEKAELRRRLEYIAELRAAAKKVEPSPSEKDQLGESPQNEGQKAKKQAPEGQPEDRDVVALRRLAEPRNYVDLIGSQGGLTPLLLAAREGHTDAALDLIKGGADINQGSAADHTTPMLIAMINGNFDLAMLLFERGADPNTGERRRGHPALRRPEHALGTQVAPSPARGLPAAGNLCT